MKDASISLGQFESSPRLDRTIPHKIFESMIMKLPLITAYSPAVESFSRMAKVVFLSGAPTLLIWRKNLFSRR